MEKIKAVPCEQEKKEYHQCLSKWTGIHEELCKPEKTWYEICVRFEGIKLEQKLNDENLKLKSQPK